MSCVLSCIVEGKGEAKGCHQPCPHLSIVHDKTNMHSAIATDDNPAMRNQHTEHYAALLVTTVTTHAAFTRWSGFVQILL